MEVGFLRGAPSRRSENVDGKPIRDALSQSEGVASQGAIFSPRCTELLESVSSESSGKRHPAFVTQLWRELEIKQRCVDAARVAAKLGRDSGDPTGSLPQWTVTESLRICRARWGVPMIQCAEAETSAPFWSASSFCCGSYR